MAALKKCFQIKSRDFIHAGEASITVQNMLKQIGIDAALIRRVAICAYEGEMNVVMHGEDGTFCIEVDTEKIVLDIADQGPGIEDIEKAMEKGYSTATEEYREMGFGAGMGLPNMETHSDRLDIDSEKGRGTRVMMQFSLSFGSPTNEGANETGQSA
ncbi:MAG: ATP-binding protein [Desulfobacterales bacterium]|nr:ATP-binding protein [Desulfobacterales bacterium]